MTFWAFCDPNGAGFDQSRDLRGDASSNDFEIDFGFDTGIDTGSLSKYFPPGSNGRGSAALDCCNIGLHFLNMFKT